MKFNSSYPPFARLTSLGLSTNIKKLVLCLAFGITAPNLNAAETAIELVSFRCSLAIDAVIAEMDTQANNPVTQVALSKIDENTGQFVCIPIDDAKMFVRLQTSEMTAADKKLLFTIDTQTYQVLKTFYGN